MKNKTNFKPKVELLIQSIASEYQWLSLLKGKNKEYEPILNYLYDLEEMEKLNFDYCDSKKYQSTEISKTTGIKYSDIKKHLVRIYEDLLSLNRNTPELFDSGNSHRYSLSFCACNHFYNDFTLWLPTELNRFDRFRFPFMLGKVEWEYFWVKDILHVHEHGQSKTSVKMVGSSLNFYREFLSQKADFMNKISVAEKYGLGESELNEKLRRLAKREKM